MKVLYLAHPVSGDITGNIIRARRWLRFFARHAPSVVVICPWLPDLEVLPLRDDVPDQRERGLQRCEAAAALCDGVVLAGGRISEGMRREAAVAKKVYDLTLLGPCPPDGEEDAA
jgi:hypothetical protein